MSANKVPTALIAGVVVLVGIIVGGVIVLSQGVSENARLIVINSLIVAVFGIIPALLALAKVERVESKTDEMHHDLKNGLIPQKIKEGIEELANDPTVDSVTIHGADD